LWESIIIIRLAIEREQSEKAKNKFAYSIHRFFSTDKYASINTAVRRFLTPFIYHKRIVSMSNNGSSPLVLWYNQLGMNDVDRVGGKNASLGEMITNLSGMGVSVPNGFATTADAFNLFLDQSGVNQRIYDLLDKTDIDDVSELAKAGAQIRQWIIDTPFQPELELQ
jgi:pyruvate,water dikinase